jgi:transposase InsO family protein
MQFPRGAGEIREPDMKTAGISLVMALIKDVGLQIAAWRTDGGFNSCFKDKRLSPSMSRRGNCLDNVVAELFCSSLNSEKIKKRIYSARAKTKSEIFDYIEVPYNCVRCQKYLDQLSPHELVRQSQTALKISLEVWGNAQLARLRTSTSCTTGLRSEKAIRLSFIAARRC